MEYQTLFSGKNKITLFNLSSAELVQRVVKIKVKTVFSGHCGELQDLRLAPVSSDYFFFDY